MPTNRWKTYLIRATLLVPLGLFVGVALPELAARLVRPPGHSDLLFNSPEAIPRGFYVTDADLLLRPAAGFRGEITLLGRPIPLRINRHGLRGAELPDVRPRAWLTVGDSFTISTQVTEQQTFQAQLRQQTGVAFWNGGVDGYSTWQATRRYKSLATNLRPEGVVLVYFLGNDLTDNERFPHIMRHRGHVTGGAPIPLVPTPRSTRWLMAHSHLYAHLRVWEQWRRMPRQGGHFFRQWRDELALFCRSGAARRDALLGVSRRALEQLKQQTAARGHKLMVAVAPPAFVVDQQRVEPTLRFVGLDPKSADLTAPGRGLLALLRQLKIPACDLTPALAAARARGEQVFYVFDGHWTPAGHRVVARAMAACLERHRLLSAPPHRAATTPR